MILEPTTTTAIILAVINFVCSHIDKLGILSLFVYNWAKGGLTKDMRKTALAAVAQIADEELSNKDKRDYAVNMVMSTLPAWAKPFVHEHEAELLVENAWHFNIKPKLEELEKVTAVTDEAPSTEPVPANEEIVAR